MCLTQFETVSAPHRYGLKWPNPPLYVGLCHIFHSLSSCPTSQDDVPDFGLFCRTCTFWTFYFYPVQMKERLFITARRTSPFLPSSSVKITSQQKVTSVADFVEYDGNFCWENKVAEYSEKQNLKTNKIYLSIYLAQFTIFLFLSYIWTFQTIPHTQTQCLSHI